MVCSYCSACVCCLSPWQRFTNCSAAVEGLLWKAVVCWQRCFKHCCQGHCGGLVIVDGRSWFTVSKILTIVLYLPYLSKWNGRGWLESIIGVSPEVYCVVQEQRAADLLHVFQKLLELTACRHTVESCSDVWSHLHANQSNPADQCSHCAHEEGGKAVWNCLL